MQDKIKDLKNVITSFSRISQELLTENEMLKIRLDEKQKQLEKAERNTEELRCDNRREVNYLNEQIKCLKTEKSSIKEAYDNLLSEKNDISKKKSTLLDENKTYKKETENLRNQVEKLNRTIESLEIQLEKNSSSEKQFENLKNLLEKVISNQKKSDETAQTYIDDVTDYLEDIFWGICGEPKENYEDSEDDNTETDKNSDEEENSGGENNNNTDTVYSSGDELTLGKFSDDKSEENNKNENIENNVPWQ